MGFNVAIDGPAGAGKSTIAKRVAKKLGFIYVDTGALYRAIALYMVMNQVDGSDAQAIESHLGEVNVSIRHENGEQQVFLNGENVTSQIRTEQVSKMASQVSVYLAVREKLRDLQLQLAKDFDVIMDGRDIGTNILPNANVKIYLTASPKIRAQRRYLELTEKEIDCNIEEIETEIIERDNRDMHREIAPLRQAEDAVLVDSSAMSLEEATNAIISLIQMKE